MPAMTGGGSPLGAEGMSGRCCRSGGGLFACKAIAFQARRPLPSLDKAWVLLMLLLPLALGPTSAQQTMGAVTAMEAELEATLVPAKPGSDSSSSNPSNDAGKLEPKGLTVETSKKGAEADAPKPPMGTPAGAPPKKGVEADGSNLAVGGSGEACDLTQGQWVRDDSYPLYPDDCKYADGRENCIANGRPDRDFEHWRWAPHNCSLPKFDSQKFLRLMRNKTIMFIGDSLLRNQFQSLLCLLKVEGNLTKEGSDEHSRHIFFVPSTNTTILFYRDTHLVRAEGGNQTVCPGLSLLHVDLVGDWFPMALKADVVVLSTGAWWRKRRLGFVRGGQLLGYYLCGAGQSIAPTGPLLEAFRVAAMSLKESSEFKGILLVEASSPDHFIRSPKVPAGTCTRFTEPSTKPELVDFDINLSAKELQEFQNSTFEDDKRFKFLNILPMASMRRDAHPNAYNFKVDPAVLASQLEKFGRPVREDCFHWCMPGAIDNWNELIFASYDGSK